MMSFGALPNIKHILQKDYFNNNDEKVLSVCTVTKTLKKKRPSYLCIVSTPPPNSVISICQLKQYERDSEYKRKRNWAIDELKYVDGKNDSSDTREFDMMLDKLYKWCSISLHERQNFLVVLYKHARLHIKHKIPFNNVPMSWLMDKSTVETVGKAVEQVAENNSDDYEATQTLTERELSVLSSIVAESEFAVKDAEQFIDKLGKNLHDLDGANIESVLTSGLQVKEIMVHIEKAVIQAENIETLLDTYDEILGHVRETMEKMGGKNQMIEIVNNNHIKLMNELNRLVTQLDIPHEHQLALSEPDLKTPSGREAAIAAAKILQRCMNADINPILLRLQAVQDQRKRFEKWKAKFSITVGRYLNNLFIHLGNDMAENVPMSTDLTLPKHTTVHKELIAYTALMHWTKAMDRKTYDGLAKVYTSSLSKIYERDVRNFFSQARIMISSKFRGSREELNLSGAKGKQSANIPYGTLGVNKELWSSGVEPSERSKFDAILENVLGELEPIALAEQTFCINFFQLDVISSSAKNTQTTLDALEQVAEKQDQDTTMFPQKKIDRQINEDVRKMMMSLFGCLEPELNSFIQSFERLDSFYSLYVLVRLSQHVMSAQDTHSFLSMTFASALVHVKRSFDKFMQQQLQSIRESKVPKRSKCGILPYVENFEEFAQTTEEIFKKSERRADIDKWYIQLVNTIFECIPLHAVEHQKTPSDVVKMENNHHMHSLLAQLKVTALEPLKKEAKQRYNDSLKSYVIKYFGRPLEKLNLFFDGVQQKVSQGVKETEISYQMAYSKQELRKVISQYPAREVKKGLENLYKKVEKHLCEEENLLQVVWYAMQEEFIAQYNFLEERIQKCYAGAMITLEFTIHDILTFFSEIARSH